MPILDKVDIANVYYVSSGYHQFLTCLKLAQLRLIFNEQHQRLNRRESNFRSECVCFLNVQQFQHSILNKANMHFEYTYFQITFIKSRISLPCDDSDEQINCFTKNAKQQSDYPGWHTYRQSSNTCLITFLLMAAENVSICFLNRK